MTQLIIERVQYIIKAKTSFGKVRQIQSGLNHGEIVYVCFQLLTEGDCYKLVKECVHLLLVGNRNCLSAISSYRKCPFIITSHMMNYACMYNLNKISLSRKEQICRALRLDS